jgi:NAD(P)-dependent dehydrogenase (short-subunit alcohol dehydrogenase family)
MLQKKADIADLFYLPSWQRRALHKLSGRDDSVVGNARKSRWLIFNDACGLGARIAARLTQAGHIVINVQPGDSFKNNGKETYIINPRAREDYGALVRELCAQGQTPDAIAHLWSVTAMSPAWMDNDSLLGTLDAGFYSLLFLAQAWSEQGLESPLQLDIISNNMQQVTGDEALDPVKATLLGPCKVFPLEHLDITCRSIDVPSLKPGRADEERLVDHILAEMLTKSSDPVVAFRGPYRWVQTFEPVRLDQSTERPATLRPNGVYLITGGLGGIGLTLADYLAETGPVKLVLTGRSTLPAREEWPRWLAEHGETDQVGRRINGVQALEAKGAEVLVCRADVANFAEMQAAIACALERFGAIHGVIHSAGLPGGESIQNTTARSAADVFAPKLTGTLVLAQLLRDCKLDFLVLFSSLAAIAPSSGQVDYSAANAFLDAFASDFYAMHGTACISINWDTWQEVGMAANFQISRELSRWREQRLKRHCYRLRVNKLSPGLWLILCRKWPSRPVTYRC